MNGCRTDLRVRYQETDNMGVVYYGNYFTWMEVARTEHFRKMGISYKAIEDKGAFLMVASAGCRYKSPARYDDIVTIESAVAEIKNSSLKFEYKISVGSRLVASGESVHVFTDRSCKPMRIPAEIKAALS